MLRTLREAQLARLDARAPLFHVGVDRWVIDDAKEVDDKIMRVVDAKEGTIYRTPRDIDKRIMIPVRVTLRNDGVTPIEFRTKPQLHPENGYASVSRVLAAGEVLKGKFHLYRTLGQWIAASKKENDLFSTFTCSYKGPNDSDVDITFPIEVRGSIVEPVPDEGESWRLQHPFIWTMDCTVKPAERVYYRSRARDEKF